MRLEWGKGLGMKSLRTEQRRIKSHGKGGLGGCLPDAKPFSNRSMPAQPIVAACIPSYSMFHILRPIRFRDAASSESPSPRPSLATACHRNLFHSKDSIQAKRERDRRWEEDEKTRIGVGNLHSLRASDRDPNFGGNRHHVDSDRGKKTPRTKWCKI